jgi:tetratricopeptide (TPR) repeat protein
MRAVLSCALILLTTVLAGTGRADEDPRGEARAHYARGIELANQGLYDAALEQFNDAYVTSPHFAVLYNIGQAQMALGRPVEAIEALAKYLRDGADQVPLSRREQVQAQIGLLESRLAELSIASDRAGVVIRVDGREVGRTPLFQPVRLAAGAHTITGSLADVVPVTRTVTLGEAERQKLEVDFMTAPPEPEPRAHPAPAAPVSAVPLEAPSVLSQRVAVPTEPASHPGTTMPRAPYLIAGVGALSGAAALGVYLWNRGRYDDWRAGDAALANTTAGSADYQARATANNSLAASLTTANHAILGLSIAGGVLVAAGAALFVADRTHSRPADELSFEWAGGSSAKMAWSGKW